MHIQVAAHRKKHTGELTIAARIGCAPMGIVEARFLRGIDIKLYRLRPLRTEDP
jgi:hypothetical protein